MVPILLFSAAGVLLVVAAVCYLRPWRWRNKGRHRVSEELELADTVWPPPLPETTMPLLTASLPPEARPPDEYLERFDAALLATRAQFASIRRNFGLLELESA